MDDVHAEIMRTLTRPAAAAPVDETDRVDALGIKPPSWYVDDEEAARTSLAGTGIVI